VLADQEAMIVGHATFEGNNARSCWPGGPLLASNNWPL
jgi:hypothetical protein